MKCTEVKLRWMDHLEGHLQEDQARRLEQHLRVCQSCEAESQLLQGALGALRDSIPSLAPQTQYLTQKRLRALKKAYARQRRPIRLIDTRRLVAVAAVAAIVVSALFITSEIVLLHRGRQQPGVVPVAQSLPVEQSRLPVSAASFGSTQPLLVIQETPQLSGPGAYNRTRQERIYPPQLEVFGVNEPHLRIPANNVYYDEEQSSSWW